MENLKYIRKGKHVSQEQLGHILGFGKNTISQYENGIREPNLDTLKKLSNYFNVSVDYLIGNDNLGNDAIPVQPMYTEKQKSCIECGSSRIIWRI